jgi:SRSO17 transposase
VPGVFLAYAAAHGQAFLDRALYLPAEWAADQERRAAAGVPAGWVTGDEVYGGDRQLRMELEARNQAFVLAVKSSEPLWSWDAQGPGQRAAALLAAGIPAADWRRLSVGGGAKGPRMYDWAAVGLFRLPAPDWAHWLLVRRSLADPAELAYYVCFGLAETPLEELARVACVRWSIEEGFAAAKGEVGLDEYEVRSWTGWHRHVTLALLAHAYLAVTRATAGQAPKRGLDTPPGSLAAFKRQRGLTG